MLSRTADHLFWMARDTERAENTARMLDVNYQSALLPQSTEVATLGWQGVLSISELLPAYTANATDADAYATAVAVMGPEKGMAFVEAHPELEAVLVTRSGELLVSQDLRPILVLPPAEQDKAPGP